MDRFPLVSLCIPLHNGMQFIRPMLDSIKKLIYPNVEIIISDDDSKDNSLEIIKSYQLRDYKIFKHSKYGLVNNWNYCIDRAKGKYIKFLFQDDTIEPNCISKMVEKAEINPKIGLVFSPRYLISERPVNHKHFPENLHQGWNNIQPIQSGLTLLQDPNLLKHPHNKIGEPTNTLIRKEVFDRIGLFDPSFKQYPDLEMWLRIMTCYEIAFIKEKLASFRIHPNQATSHNLSKKDSWSEIYHVWLKLIHHPIYKVIPSSTRRNIKITLIKQLLRESIKSIIFKKLYRWDKISDLLRMTLI